MTVRPPRTPRQARALSYFHGIEFGIAVAEAIPMLRLLAEEDGPEVTVRDAEDDIGGTVRVDGAVWSYAMEYDLWRRVDRHIYRRRNQPAGLAASLAYIRERIDLYGPPDCVLAGEYAELEWTCESRRVTVMLTHRGLDWSVHEDHASSGEHARLDPPPPRELTGLVDYMGRLAAARERLDRLPLGASADLQKRMGTWIRACERILFRLAPLIAEVGVFDTHGSLAETERTIAMIEAGPPAIDGAFLVIPGDDSLELGSRIMEFGRASGLYPQGLTVGMDRYHWCRYDGPLPPSPDRYVQWFAGPLALDIWRRLVPEEHLPRVSIVPARFTLVEGAVVERLPVPALLEGEENPKIRWLLRRLNPVRVTHPPTGMSVFLNCEENAERLIRYAHTLLAALLAEEHDP